jgi:hypothetical protein
MKQVSLKQLLSRLLATIAIAGAAALLLGADRVMADLTGVNQWYPGGLAVSPAGQAALVWGKIGYSSTGKYTGESMQAWLLTSANKVARKSKIAVSGAAWSLPDCDCGGFAPDGTIRLMWYKPGATSKKGVYSGDSISITSYSDDFGKTQSGPTYTAGAGWYINGLWFAPDGTLRAMWLEPGTTNSSGVYSGDTISVWAFDTHGNVTDKGPSLTMGAGFYCGYNAYVESDGTMRMLWYTLAGPGTIRGDSVGQVSVWTISAEGNESAEGPILSDGAGCYDVGILGQASDGTLRIMWLGLNSDVDFTVTVWTLDSSGGETAEGPVYTGPYAPNWHWPGMSVAPDGTAWIKWTSEASTNKEMSLWTLNAAGTRTAEGPVYKMGGFWDTDEDEMVLSDSGGADTATISWRLPPATSTSKSGKASVWTLDATGTATVKGPTYSY